MAIATKSETVTAAPAKPKFPIIKPGDVKHDPGQYFRRVLIRLPAPGADETAIKHSDIHENPGVLWTSVQKDRHVPLRRFDEVRIIAHDESWIINSALVTEADDKKVVFSKYATVELTVPTETWSDGEASISYEGGMRFTVRNKAGAILSQGFDKLEIARNEYLRTQPRKIA